MSANDPIALRERARATMAPGCVGISYAATGYDREDLRCPAHGCALRYTGWSIGGAQMYECVDERARRNAEGLSF